MIFMSQSGIIDPRREAEWDSWYLDHLRVMLTVPGVNSAQRFTTSTPGFPRSLAMYTFASAAIFSDPYYLSIRGQGEWLPLLDKRHHHRNLFEGLAATPDVAADACLLVADRTEPAAGLRAGFTWLKAVAIDRSTPYRGIAVVTQAAADDMAAEDVAVYRPVTARLMPRQ